MQDSVDKLEAYFTQEVIHGPDAFVMVAQGYDDYARAMRRKLLRELEFPMLGSVPSPVQPASWSADN